MSDITVSDGTTIYYKEWGSGQPIVFSHGWPLNADAWDAQMLFFGQQGFRVIAHDRRSHGRSGQTWDGNEMNTYADDLAELITTLDLTRTVMVGHSTGGGEVVRYLSRHGSSRVAKAVLISAVPPVMLKSPKNPDGIPIEALDSIRTGVVNDRSQFYKDLSLSFFGYNRSDVRISEGVRENFWYQGMQSGIKGSYDCIKAFSETDFTEELKTIDIPVLVMHGDDDQIVPYSDAGALTSKLVRHSTLKIYPGFPHGMQVIHANVINKDMLDFIRA